ncbi:MAG TPA: ABC transporter ATP-binding protein [Arsenicitalea sp.]|jgi:peptide/nickel transport system ATP-binding protein|nr:ABC transporter ATP-binding protein [Arsenicitalea sp.]
MAERPLLKVEDLRIDFPSPGGGRFPAVEGLYLAMGAERLGIVGESGSGKSVTALALAGLLPPAARLTAAKLEFAGRNLLAMNRRQWTQFRGSEVGLVLQDPRSGLNPALTVGKQIGQALKFHREISRGELRERVFAVIEAVGLDNPDQLVRLYPHQLSGGMGQRVMIASMLINEPKLLIADEPTSALDEELRDQILELLVGLVDKRHMGLILISHDLAQVAKYCDRAMVMYRGKVVDGGPAANLPNSVHPYTSTLWRCRPSAATHGKMLPVLDRAALEAIR